MGLDRRSQSDFESPDVRVRRPAWRRPRVLVPVALAVSFLGAAWDSEYFSIRDYLFPRRFETVVPGALYRSGQIAARLIEPVLTEKGIKVVVDLNDDLPDSDEQVAEQRAVAKLGIDYHKFPLSGDGTGDVDSYVDAVATIARAQASARPVLVHCAAGDKRSGGVLATYLLLVKGATATDAVAEIGRCSRGHVASSTVLDFLNVNLDVIAARLEQDGIALHATRPLPRLTGGG